MHLRKTSSDAWSSSTRLRTFLLNPKDSLLLALSVQVSRTLPIAMFDRPTHILLVEDEASHAELIRYAFNTRARNVEMSIAGTLQEARAVLLKRRPDLVIADLRLPDGHGTELLPGVGETTEYPVVIMTSHGDEEVAVDAMRRGALDYVVKSDRTLAELPRIAERILREWDHIVRRRQAEEALRASKERLQRHNRVLVELTQRMADAWGNLDTTLKHLTETAGRTLEVERTSIWLFDDTRTEITCIDLYLRSKDLHTRGETLRAGDYPEYFDALKSSRILAAHDAHQDPRTRAFSRTYLLQHDISSLLDAPVRVGSEPVGILCFEQVGPARTWAPEDQIFAGSAADFVALALESARRREAQESLREREEQFRRAITLAPFPIMIHAEDGEVIRINEAWTELTGYTLEDIPSIETWVRKAYGEREAAMREWIEKLYLLEERKDEGEFVVTTRWGEQRTWDFSSSPLGRLPDGRRLVITMARDVSERNRMEKEILEISSREQRRIGEDLHDELGQLLTGVGFRLAALEDDLRQEGLPEAEEVGEIGRMVEDAIEQTRSLARGLNPIMMFDDGLSAALSALALSVEQVFGISCTFRCTHPAGASSLDLEISTHVYRIVQEAINNAVRHGKATHIVIGLEGSEDTFTVSIRDNGTGIPAPAERSRGMGLRIMAYRAHRIGGTLNVYRHEDGGTLVVCEFNPSSVSVIRSRQETLDSLKVKP